jgi:polyphosphate kinase
VDGRASAELVEFLQVNVSLSPFQVFRLDGPINLTDLAEIYNVVDREDLKYRPYIPTVREPLRNEKQIFTAVARQDVLVHHPFEAFTPVEQFVTQAARDPKVLAIKQTLYRTSGDSSIVRALIEAAQNGKQVAALMELKARFDEERNIVWARQLEKAGVHVVYGLVGLKTHAKICLVVRKEEDGLRRYVHLGTGNYNPTTARYYTDLALFTCDPDLCDDASELFNLLTGYSRMPEWRKTIMAPLQMREAFVSLIHQERGKAREGGRGRIRAKLNSLADPDMIAELYAASRDGVEIDLLVRGICCLRPGIPGVSERIRVHSVVDRFLEHSRVYIFGDEGDERVYLASADWMPRNLDRRVEIAFPIEAPALKRRVIDEIWGTYLRDNVRRRVLQPGGHYIRAPRQPGEAPFRAQFHLMQLEERHRDRREDVAPDKSIRATSSSSDLVPKQPQRPAKPSGRRVAVSAKVLFEGVPKEPPPLAEPHKGAHGTNGKAAKKQKK